MNKNAHVTLIRNSIKGISPQTEHQEEYQEENEDSFQEERQAQPYMPTPTRRGQVRRVIKSDDSIKMSSMDLWYVSDESFLEMEKACESPRKNKNEIDEANDTTLLCDIQAPSFLDSDSDEYFDDSVFERSSNRLLSPMKQVAMRRPSTILEESTIRSMNSTQERSGSSLSLKQSLRVAEEPSQSIKSRSYRPSLLNVFPTRSRIGFYDHLNSTSSPTQASVQHDSINLMRFESVERDLPSRSAAEETGNNSDFLINFDSSIEESPSSNLSVDQTQQNLSMSDSEPPDQFNDTLEAVDYYMKQGKKILDKTGASTTLLQSHVTSSPKNRNNSLLKQTLARRHLMSMNGDSKLANKKLF